METETTELKKSLAELKQGLISLVAMLNKHGQAELWFGVAPNGKPAGLDLNEKTLRDVSQAIAAHIEPRIYPEITQQTVAGKNCLRIHAAGQQKPYFAYGRAYLRVADEDRQMCARELETLILRQNRAALRWDNEPASVSLQVLNEGKIRRFVETAGLPWDDSHNALEKLDLLRDGQPVNAARLFFADEPIQLRCAVFANTTSATIIDRHDFDGDILELIEEAEKYILKNIHFGMKLDGLRRVDVPEISRTALREAIVNAFCHRDWRDPDYIHIAIYKDRVEIRNPGGLYDDLTLDDLRRGNVSRRRNPLIADLLRRIHLAEAWGRGMSLILENAPTATFREVAGLFIASFQRPTVAETTLEPPKTILETNLETPETILETSETILESTKETLLKLLHQQPQLTTQALAQATGLSAAGVKYHLAQFKRSGKLRRHGPTKNGYWEVID
ncbi:MAG: putative DNA binding domain-containing protein [Pseudomonadales bacterium]|jgi:ATP-dependent DNA helicase RecG|nr:putative DNA binding domain-containing protein [Pseudomonadales bacterium]